MARSERDKKILKEKAAELVAGGDVEIWQEETTGDDDFKYEKCPDVCAVVVDKGSGRGYVQISGAGKDTEIIHTGHGEPGFVKAEISAGQTCMLYGRPTVLYIRPVAFEPQ